MVIIIIVVEGEDGGGWEGVWKGWGGSVGWWSRVGGWGWMSSAAAVLKGVEEDFAVGVEEGGWVHSCYRGVC